MPWSKFHIELKHNCDEAKNKTVTMRAGSREAARNRMDEELKTGSEQDFSISRVLTAKEFAKLN